MAAHRMRWWLIGALAIAASEMSAQRGGLRVRVAERRTGVPIREARVMVKCEGCFGRWPTDSLGQMVRTGLPAGDHRVEVHCPSLTSVGRHISDVRVTIKANAVTEMRVDVVPGWCAEPPFREIHGTFRGEWTPGFEASAFVPCADTTLGVNRPLLPGPRISQPSAWAQFSAGAMRQQLSYPPNLPRDAYGNPTYFVVWRGVLRGPGKYGHMGVSNFEMVVDSVLAIRDSRQAGCAT